MFGGVGAVIGAIGACSFLGKVKFSSAEIKWTRVSNELFNASDRTCGIVAARSFAQDSSIL